MHLLFDLLTSNNPNFANFRPTEIYNENWLLKLILHHASNIDDDDDYPLNFMLGSTWYSEALLPTPFAARYRGDKMAESHTNADGVIGHFTIGASGKADLELHHDARQFTLVEAKIYAGLSKGVKADPGYDQAARSVACMAETIARAGLSPGDFNKIGFLVIAPRSETSKEKFKAQMSLESIDDKVRTRIRSFSLGEDDWFTNQFQPLLPLLELSCLSWEDVIQWIGETNPEIGDGLNDFYMKCLTHN